MSRVSDMFARGSGVQRKFCASVWLVAAAMGAALLAAPSAAHADVLSLTSTDTLRGDFSALWGLMSSCQLVFDSSQFQLSGSSDGSFTLKEYGNSVSGTFTQTSPTTSSGNIRLNFPTTTSVGDATSSLSASLTKDGSSFVTSGYLSARSIPSTSDGYEVRFQFYGDLPKDTRLLFYVPELTFAYNDSTGEFSPYRGALNSYKHKFYSDGLGWQDIPIVDGIPTLPHSAQSVSMCIRLVPGSDLGGWRFFMPSLTLYAQIPDSSVTSAIGQQTDELMDTSGSGSVGSGAVSGSQSAMQEHMSFMEQVDALGDMFTSITADSDSRVTFPGISFGEVQIPPATVDIWEHMKPLETSCKTICTGVFIFAWFNGMRSVYGRVFHDEKDVIVD